MVAPLIRSFGGNLYGICFANNRCLELALEDAPFIISKSVFHIQLWSVGLEFDEIDLSGVLLRVEDLFEDDVGRGFLRVRVLIDVKKPLAKFFWIPRFDDGRTKAFLRYEKLQNYCYSCGKLGHTMRSCTAMLKPNHREMKYKIDLCAEVIRFSMTVRRNDISVKVFSVQAQPNLQSPP